jgi:pantetheine-phosphate adenylyltransferase
MPLVAIFPGSFDPLTNGHVEILETALALADRVVVAIGVNPTKAALFTPDERAEMIREVVGLLGASERVAVVAYDGLIVEAARAAGATVLVRGLRDGSDLDYEMQMAGMNAAIAPEIRTVFVPASPRVRHLSATLVRQVAHMGGDISGFVPQPIARALSDGRSQ